MAREGRPPKPIEQKRRTGNPGKRALPDSTDLVAVPPVDASVSEITVEQALERSLAAGESWLAESDALGVVLLREALEHYADLKADARAKPKELQDALKLIGSFAADLGFNPTERSRLGLAEVKAQSVAESIISKRAARATQVS